MNDPDPGEPHAGPEAERSPLAFVAPGALVAAGVRLGPGSVVLAPDDPDARPTQVHRDAVIGANATILPGVTVGIAAEVRPGAVVSKAVPAYAIAEGNPARIVGYRATDRTTMVAPVSRALGPSGVAGVVMRSLTTASDMRGSLAAAEAGSEIPFTAQRWFVVYDVPNAETRGEHAHRRCHQFLIAVHGSLRVVADDGYAREEFLLDDPAVGLYLPAMTWGVQYAYSLGAVLLVLASDPYDPDDYIRDYGEYLEAVGRTRRDLTSA